MSVRMWISVATAVFLALIVFLARHEILKAWELLGTVNLWILALLIPVQFASYLSVGEMMFSYLRAKKDDHHIPPLQQARMALELNFVNHILPSGGVSGISYMNWRLGKYNVSAGRATVAQLVRYIAGFGAFITLLLVAVVMVTLDGHINRVIILLSGAIVFGMVFGTVALVYLVSRKERFEKFANWIAVFINRLGRLVLGKNKTLVRPARIIKFFDEMHQEYVTIMRERRVLVKPYLWGLLFNVFEVLLFMITFWALGVSVNPASVLIAFGLASIAGFIMVTPGGAGAYEAIMASFLASAGVDPTVAIAGTVLTRAILLLGTIIVGYLFYQHALIVYGKPRT